MELIDYPWIRLDYGNEHILYSVNRGKVSVYCLFVIYITNNRRYLSTDELVYEESTR